jgi:hypothetical protein
LEEETEMKDYAREEFLYRMVGKVTRRFPNQLGIYAIVCHVNQKTYIGKGVLYGRDSYHRSTLNSGKHGNQYLQADWNKYGPDAFDIIPLYVSEQYEDPEFVDMYEDFWIALTRATDRRFGYNKYKKPRHPNKFDFVVRINPLH